MCLESDITDGIARIKLARPDVGNALDLPTAYALKAAVTGLAGVDIAAVVISADGPLFCAGGDVLAMAAASDRVGFVRRLADTMHDALRALRALPVPVVAAVQGTAAGAGLGIVLAADVVIASDKAKFVSAYGRIGVSPDCGVTGLLPTTIGVRRAARFLLTDLVLDASTAADWGLITEHCPPDDLDARVSQVVAALCDRPRAAVGEAARLVRLAAERGFADQLEDEAATIARLSGTADADALIRQFASGTH
ncbi:MAG TPA: enoyl-CoA hydratase/isomerase family protein [Jatrophihabitans sp.]